jgi:APA family basic amino acid/polyamine antiporter
MTTAGGGDATVARRRLSVLAATSMVVTQTIGVGIFLTPATMMRTLGSAWAALAMWGVMGTLSAAGALCYAELSTRFPKAGGSYVYLREAFGPRVAFLYGWIALLVVDPGLTAALGIGFSQYLLATIDGSQALTPYVAVGAIAAFGGLTLLGLGVSSRAMEWTAVAKLAIVVVLAIVALARVGSVNVSPAIAPSAGALAGSLIAAFFAFGGWWELGRMSEEVASPRTTMPLALVGGIALVTLIYSLVSLAYMAGTSGPMPPSDDAFVVSVGTALFGEAAGRLLSAMVVVAVAGSLAAVLLYSPRVYLAMARDGLFPARLARYDRVRGTMPLSTTIQIALACALALVGTFEEILGYFVPCAVFFLGLSTAALLVLPRPQTHEDAFRAPLHPLPVLLFLLLVVVVLLLFLTGQPRQTLLGALVVAAGIPVARLAVPSGPRR